MAPGFLFMALASKTPVCVNDREPPFMAPEVAALQRRQSSISHGLRTTPEQLQSKDLPLIATSRLDRELVNAHASVVIQLGALRARNTPHKVPRCPLSATPWKRLTIRCT